ncbi:Uncharacterized protein HKD37_06G015914 [Glycine soja]
MAGTYSFPRTSYCVTLTLSFPQKKILSIHRFSSSPLLNFPQAPPKAQNLFLPLSFTQPHSQAQERSKEKAHRPLGSLNISKRQHEEELKLLEEETARRLEEAIRKNVEEKLNTEEVKLEIERRVAEGVKKLFDDVEAQLEKGKEDALTEARRKEEQARKEREELDLMLEENRRRVEESQRKEALEQQRKEEERQRELEMIQRQKEEAALRKKLEDEEEHANRINSLGKNKSRPKSYGF